MSATRRDADEAVLPDGTESLGKLGPTAYRYRCCRLTVIEGPDTGRSAAFDSGSVSLGTQADRDFPLTDRAVSREHAILELARDGYRLRDEGSSNGTFVDGVQVREAYLRPGCIVSLGRTRLRFDSADEEIAAPPSPRQDFHGIVGSSPAIRQLFSVLERLGPTAVSVLVTGPTGTGKEMVARALHDASTRAKAPFVVFDCANTDREFIRSELFGHEVGAFTGATASRAGAFERAEGGTVFLDEAGELPVDLQPRLLRVLQERRLTRLGGTAERKVNVRVVSATNRDLLGMVAAGQFREDLYYRLAQVVVRVPSLRERLQDVPVLARAFLASTAPGKRFTPEALEKLMRHAWPGNVRELRNCVEVAAALARGLEIGPGDIELAGPLAALPETVATAVQPGTLDDVERETIARALAQSKGNISETARVLGITRPTLRAKLRKYGLRDG